MNYKHVFLFSICILIFAGVAGCSRGRSDAQITADVLAMLKADSTLASKQIAVQTDSGTVSLSGNVASEGERTAAEKVANQVVGVKRVINNLEVVAAAAAPPAASPKPSAQMQEPAPVRAARRAVTTPPKTSATTTPPGAPARSAAVPVPPPAPAPVIVPGGTAVSIRLIDPVDTAKNKEGDTFRASLESPIVVDGKTIVPKNADVEARLMSAKSAGHFTGSSSVVLVLTKITVDKKAYEIKTGQFTKQGASRGKRTAIVVGGGTAAGAVIGGIVGGGKGAAIGAAAGAAGGAGVQELTKSEQIQLPSETVLEFQLTEPFTVMPTTGSGQQPEKTT